MTARQLISRYRAACAGVLIALGAVAVVYLGQAPKPLTAAELRSRSDALYTDAQIRDIAVQLDAEAWSSLERKPRRFVPAQIEHDGETYHARVRIKGHRSRRKLGEKPAFKIEFPDGGIEGAHALNLNNLVEDPTQQREVLAYRLMAALGILVPRVAYARVALNGAPKGLYLMVEPLDDLFLAQRSPAPSARGESGDLLYEGEYGCDVQESDVGGFDLDAGKDGQRSELRAFANVAAGDARALFDARDGPLDMRAFTSYLAASAVAGDFDGYRHAHNYYLHYAAADQKWRFLPWGLDRAFTKRLALLDSQGVLARRCFRDPACKLEYVRALSRVTQTFESLGLPAASEQLTARLDAAAGDMAEPGGKTPREVRKARARLQSFLRERPGEVREQLGCIDAEGRELDRDGDGHGCTDCNDQSPAIHPGAAESCDTVDNDCSGLIDDAPECACNAALIGETEYQLCALPMPWAEAARFCEEKGSSLVRIDDKQLSKALYAKARAIDEQRWWIGFSDREREGDFRWRDGTKATFNYWSKRQPDNGSCNEDCAALKENGKGKWHDTHCNQHRPFICGPAAPPSQAAGEP